MLLRADHRAIEDAGIGDSAAPVAAAPAGNDHAVQGTIAPPAPAAAIAPKQAAVAPPPHRRLLRRPPRARRRGACRAGSQRQTAAGDEAERAAAEGQRRDRRCAGFDPAFAAAGRQTRAAGRTGTCPAQVTQRAPQARRPRTPRGRSPSATKSETPETAALVRESAKLDPSLPPPSMSSVSSMPASTGSYRQGSSSSGANPVAAAMTEQLVRQSSSFKSTAPAPADGSPTATK